MTITSNMEDEIAQKLKTKNFKRVGSSSGGCISSGNVYETDTGKVFVKTNEKPGADVMFHGEYKGLLTLKSFGFVVPSPLCLGKNYLVMEYVDMKSLREHMATLGTNLAKLHDESGKNSTNFGFETTTCCGFLPMCNDWQDDWVQFYATQRLEPQIRDLGSDRELSELWSQLQIRIPEFFKDIQVRPCLLHGDLWSGNAAETKNGPITFDPASFYGHSEFDLAIGKMFGGFSRPFLEAYHKIQPKQPGFQTRQNLYLLFHHLNHWRHFGDSYRNSTLKLMSTLTKDKTL